MSNWHGLIEILEINHIRDGEIIWQNFNLKNVLHQQGELYFLQILFANGSADSMGNTMTVPPLYYFGLDNRSTISVTDTLSSISGEPTTNNYQRQVANSTTNWTFGTSTNGNNQAKSPILTFGAYGGSWGPVCNLFLTMQPQTTDNTNGYLISSVYLGNAAITVIDGDSISLRMSATLSNSN
jgi:hypothetical protein